MSLVVGTVTCGGRHRPFLFDPTSGRLELDRSLALDGASGPLETAGLVLLASTVGPFEAVRVGEFWCATCEHWRRANKAEWSVGLCLSCSLDRASELSDELG